MYRSAFDITCLRTLSFERIVVLGVDHSAILDTSDQVQLVLFNIEIVTAFQAGSLVLIQFSLNRAHVAVTSAVFDGSGGSHVVLVDVASGRTVIETLLLGESNLGVLIETQVRHDHDLVVEECAAHQQDETGDLPWLPGLKSKKD